MPRIFFGKSKYPTHCRNLKYDADQEIRTRPARPGDISQEEIPKFNTCNQQADWIHHRREIIFHHRSPSGSQGRKELRTKIRDETNEVKLKGLVKELEALDCRLILRTKNTYSWMNVRGTSEEPVGNTILSEFSTKILSTTTQL